MEGVLSTSNVSDNLMKMSLNARLIAVLDIVAIVAQSVNVAFLYSMIREINDTLNNMKNTTSLILREAKKTTMQYPCLATARYTQVLLNFLKR